MEIKLIYSEPILRNVLDYMDKINESGKATAHFEGKGNGEVDMIINITGGKTNEH